MLIVVLLDENYSVTFYSNKTVDFLYRGFSSLYIFFIPHILTIIGLIGWLISVKKNNNDAIKE